MDAPEPATTGVEGGEVDLGALFREHAPFLVRVVARMVGSVDRAEDVVQRTFMTAHRKGVPRADRDVARAWLYRVAMNEVRHERRSVARRLRLAFAASQERPAAPATPGDAAEAASTAAEVRRVVGQLPEAQREVFVLYELEELSGGEIASLLGVPENTVWSRLRLARGRFRKLWASREDAS
jgi:RNA polymerase sigma-70 factor (ECF subfamily)